MFEYLKDLISPPIKNYRIFYFHIAKCGGTSISNAIVNSYKPWRSDMHNLVVTLNENAARFAEQHSMMNGKHFRRDLLNYMMSCPEIKCISGHFHYSNVAHEIYEDKWNFVTVLRNPVERWFSHYNYNTREGADERFRINLPLEEFIETDKAKAFGRAFVDEITEDLDFEKTGIEKKTEIALERYQRFSLVGTVNNLRDFEQKFAQKFNHKLSIKHLNRTPKSKNKNQGKVTDEILARVEQLCEPDIYVYNKLFD